MAPSRSLVESALVAAAACKTSRPQLGGFTTNGAYEVLCRHGAARSYMPRSAQGYRAGAGTTTSDAQAADASRLAGKRSAAGRGASVSKVPVSNHGDNLNSVAALFVRSDSCYFDLGLDCWDAIRDARGYAGSAPVIAHPPCRGWGRLSHLAKPRPDEKALALFAVDTVRRCGGVLEHPVGSKLWAAKQLPRAGAGCDEFGGFTLVVDQGWWGHPAPKPTYLYIVGCTRTDVGELPVQLRRAAGRTMELSPADRERTPPLFAEFLVGIARKCAGSVLLRPGVSVTPSQDHGSYADLVAGAAAKRAAFKAWSASV